MKKVAINGFGRIGRSFLRALTADEGRSGKALEVVGINDLGNLDQLAHLLKYDSAFGRIAADVRTEGGNLLVNGRKIRVTQERDPEKLGWSNLGVDVVVESTGVLTDAHKAKAHLAAGAKKVVISAPAKNEDLTVVYGVNHDKYDRARHDIVSNASCTTNCLAPVVKVLHETVGIESGIMTTIHAFTQDQNLQDGPHRDPRRARSAAVNMVPTSTGAAKAIGIVIPELEGRLDGYSVRVPVITGSLVDLVVQVKRDTTADEINQSMKAAAAGPLAGILKYTEDPLVSTDVVHDDASAIFDSQLTKVIGGRHVKVMAWYDNEWGFSSRLVDTVRHVVN